MTNDKALEAARAAYEHHQDVAMDQQHSSVSTYIAALEDAHQAMQARAEKAERERDEARQAVDAFSDICVDLGVERDNEAGLQAAHDLKARVKELEEERDALRKVISECASALPNGAFVSPKASLEFMAKLPAEIASVCTAFKGGSNG